MNVETKRAIPNDHYTVVELTDVQKMPRRKGVGKVKAHLTSIYREFIRKGVLQLKLDGTELSFQEPKVLYTQRYDDPKGEKVLWKKDIDLSFEDEGLSIRGFIGIRETGSTAEAGVALFRRGRVIEGSFDNGFRPEQIFGSPNSFRYQRIFGELHLKGFDVSFTKKGIMWDDNLDTILSCLKHDISTKAFPLLQQADNYRPRATEKDYKATSKALEQTAYDLQSKASAAIESVLRQPPIAPQPDAPLPPTDKSLHKEFTVQLNDVNWEVSLELSYDPSVKDMIEVGDHLVKNPKNIKSVRQVGVRLSLTHDFMREFVGVENAKIEPVLRIAAALGLAEVIAKQSGAKTQGEVRRNFNELITKLSNPL